MAAVTEYLTQLLAKQVEDRGLVVWYDPEKGGFWDDHVSRCSKSRLRTLHTTG